MLPDSVLTGFMASIGYLILHKAFRTSMPVDVWTYGPGSEKWWRESFFSCVIVYD